jgi:hypothetical protein
MAQGRPGAIRDVSRKIRDRWVIRPCLHQQHAPSLVFAEPRRNHTASRPATHHDDVESHACPLNASWPGPSRVPIRILPTFTTLVNPAGHITGARQAAGQPPAP